MIENPVYVMKNTSSDCCYNCFINNSCCGFTFLETQETHNYCLELQCALGNMRTLNGNTVFLKLKPPPSAPLFPPPPPNSLIYPMSPPVTISFIERNTEVIFASLFGSFSFCTTCCLLTYCLYYGDTLQRLKRKKIEPKIEDENKI